MNESYMLEKIQEYAVAFCGFTIGVIFTMILFRREIYGKRTN